MAPFSVIVFAFISIIGCLQRVTCRDTCGYDLQYEYYCDDNYHCCENNTKCCSYFTGWVIFGIVIGGLVGLAILFCCCIMLVSGIVELFRSCTKSRKVNQNADRTTNDNTTTVAQISSNV